MIEVELVRLNSLMKSESGIRKNKVIYFIPDREPANYYLITKWMEVLPTISGHWGWLLFAVFQKLSKSHLIAQPIIRDTNNLLAKMPKILNFSSYELKLGEEFLRSVGCENNKFVCLMVRDSTYLSTIRKDKDFSHYEYRDSKISTYLEGAEKLAELGYTVFRMGQIVKDPLKSSNSKVIDYATNGMRTEFLDIFLGAHCSFYVSTGTGIDTVAQIFRRPMLYLNVIGFYDDIATNNYLFYPKTYFDEFSLKKLSLREIAMRGLIREVENQKFKATGTAVEDLTSEEISDALLEIASRVEGRYSPTVLAMNLQREVDLIFKTDPNLGGQLSGEFASCFLSRHPNFLDGFD